MAKSKDLRIITHGKAHPVNVVGPKPSLPIDDIRRLWEAIYQLGDDAIARMKAGCENEDIQSVVDASNSFELARKAAQQIGPVEDMAFLGGKFKTGRKPNTGGVIRKAIARLLQKTHSMKNPELWAEVTAKPPRGWTAYDNRAGKYLEGPAADDHMVQGRFFTICGEERKKIKR